MMILTMVYKLVKVAEKGWIRLKRFTLLSKIIAGITFKDDEEVMKNWVA